MSEAQERLNVRCEQIKSQVLEVKAQVKSTAKSIVDEAKAKGRAALYRVSEFLEIKKRLLDIRENVRGAIKTTDKDIAKTALLAKGFREAGQTAANAFRTFADKSEVDYSQKEQKHPITKAVLAPMKAVRKLFVLMELHLDASIDKLDNLAMNVQLDKEKHMENAKAQEQTEPEMAEAERVEAEIVYAPMVAEPQEYQYNADAFEEKKKGKGKEREEKKKKGEEKVKKNKKKKRINKKKYGFNNIEKKKKKKKSNESMSISNQKLMLRDFAEKNGMFQYEYYVDDGYTGRNFNRPSFQRMIADIEAGKIGCVITKDLSRLGRNYIEAGSYIEIFFSKAQCTIYCHYRRSGQSDPSGNGHYTF